MFITSDASERLDAELAELQTAFPMTLQERPEYFLGMNIEYIGPARIRLSCRSYAATMQANYADDVARASNPAASTLLPTPILWQPTNAHSPANSIPAQNSFAHMAPK
jgi:hypothetical protein